MALIGVYLVILDFELDPPDLDLPPVMRPLVSDNSTIIIRTMATSNTVANCILSNGNDV